MTRGEALQTLGLEPDADHEMIRRRYRRLCLKLHPDLFQDPREKTEAHGAFLRVCDAYEFFRKNRSLFRAPRRASERWSPERRDDWDRELESMLKRRMREARPQTARGAAADWWEKLGEEKVRAVITFGLAAVMLMPVWSLLLAEFWRLLMRSLTTSDVVLGSVFLAASLKLARSLRARP